MAYKIFVDSDIFLDILLIRQPHFANSLSILQLRLEYRIELYTSSSIILNVNYIAQKQTDKEKALTGILEILKAVEIIDTNKEILTDCFNSKHKDVEDAVQYFTALNNGSLNYFITRNIRRFNFKNWNLPVLTPTQFLKIINQNS